MEMIVYEAPIPEEIANKVAEACERILGSLQRDDFYWNIANRSDICFVLAIEGTELAGFKLGFSKGQKKFYSWMGGVEEKWRKKGLAKELMKIQHNWCRTKKFEVIETQTLNQWKEMLNINLRSGFEIKGVYESRQFGLKIILEKKLID